MTTKFFASAALGIALAATPFLAFAHDDSDKDVNTTAFDKTAVSIAIADDGSVLVRGAKVTDVSDDVITAQTSVRDVTMTWKIDTDSDTDFLKVSGSSTSLGNISDGDYVSFSGTLTGSSMFTVNADTVRDWSLDDSVSVSSHWWAPIMKWPMWSFFAHAKGGTDH
jgi:hypothetical protein